MNAPPLDLHQMLDFNPVEGQITVRGKGRFLLMDADALGIFRSELINTLGPRAARVVLNRFGYNYGYADAVRLRELYQWDSDQDWFYAGLSMITLEGLGHTVNDHMEYDRAGGYYYAYSRWVNSFEAEQHIRRHGEWADEAEGLCWILSGYVSGYTTAFLGQEVLWRETECRARGDERCFLVGKTLGQWLAEGFRVEPMQSLDLARALRESNQKLKGYAAQLERANHELREARDYFETLMDIAPVAISVINSAGVRTYTNQATLQLFGYSRDELVGAPVKRDFGLQGIDDIVRELYQSRRPVRGYPTTIVTKEGEERSVEVSASALRDTNGAVIGSIGVGIDVTERERAQEAIRQRNKELSTLNAIAETLSGSLDLDRILNNTLHQILNLMEIEAGGILLLKEPTDELVLRAHWGLSPQFVERVAGLKVGEGWAGRVVQTGEPVVIANIAEDSRLSRLIVWEDGFQSFASVPIQAKDRILGACNVISRRRRAFRSEEVRLLVSIGQQLGLAVENARLHEQVQRDLRMKQDLLQEMHHRVKNNLATVVGFLGLEAARHEGQPKEAAPLRRSIDRIAAIAAVHELLFHQEAGYTSFERVAQIIAGGIIDQARTEGRDVRILVENTSGCLSARRATSLALILNELLSNALTHGFRGRREGTVWVQMNRCDSRGWLEVKDDGIGLPTGFDLARDAGIGLQVISNLVRRDLEGTFTLESAGGVRAVVCFPEARE
ncbi:MAG: XylR N-terminal domain-containing protein [Ardenticatenaceae bacterium]|nr:XylR N-terminal domain-containing protein [Ardenticatenaceae bacterium]